MSLAAERKRVAGPVASARKQRAYRRRLRSGTLVAFVEVPQAVVAALVDGGRLPSDQAWDRQALGQALAGLAVDWSVEYMRKRYG